MSDTDNSLASMTILKCRYYIMNNIFKSYHKYFQMKLKQQLVRVLPYKTVEFTYRSN